MGPKGKSTKKTALFIRKDQKLARGQYGSYRTVRSGINPVFIVPPPDR
jgi:hypothetical protein